MRVVMHNKIIKALVGAFMALALAVGVNVAVDTNPVTEQTAQAATYTTVCNSENSDGEIRAFNTHVSPNYSKTLYPGQCASNVRDDGGWARVDVDPPGGWIDVDSWTKRKLGDPWTSLCYESENHASDPFSYPAYGTTYWVFQYNGCTNA